MRARRLRRFLAADDASGIVEFALAAGIFFTLVLGIIEFGALGWEKNDLASDAREGARFASVRGAASGRTASATDVSNYVLTKSSMSGSITVSTTWDPTDKRPGSVVTVTVSKVSPRRGYFLPGGTVSSTSKMIVVF